MAKYKLACFESREEATVLCDRVKKLIKEPLRGVGVNKDDDGKYVINSRHEKAGHNIPPLGVLFLDEETGEPAYFEFLAWEADLNSGEECLWQVALDGREISSKVIGT